MVIYAMKITQDGESLRFEEAITGGERFEQETASKNELVACKILRDKVKSELGKWIAEATGSNVEMEVVENGDPISQEKLSRKLERSVKKLLEVARREEKTADDIVSNLPPFKSLMSRLDEVLANDDMKFEEKEELCAVAVTDFRMGRLVGMMAIASMMFGEINVRAR